MAAQNRHIIDIPFLVFIFLSNITYLFIQIFRFSPNYIILLLLINYNSLMIIQHHCVMLRVRRIVLLAPIRTSLSEECMQHGLPNSRQGRQIPPNRGCPQISMETNPFGKSKEAGRVRQIQGSRTRLGCYGDKPVRQIQGSRTRQHQCGECRSAWRGSSFDEPD